MELRQITYFHEVARQLHFTRAAANLRVAQPHLSREIRRLETAVGAQLFRRTTRAVDLTEAGHAFLRRTQTVLADLETAAESARAAQSGQHGNLVLGFAGSITYSWLPYLVQEYRARYPEVNLEIRTEMFTGEQVRALSEGRLDVGLLRPPIDHQDIQWSHLADDELVAAVPSDHRLAKSPEPLDLSVLADEPFIMYGGSDSTTRRAVLSACFAAGFTPSSTQTVFETHSVISLVAAGVGLALLPGSAAYFAVRGVTYRSIQEPKVLIPLAIARPAGTARATAQNFLDIALAVATAPTAPGRAVS